MSIFQVKTKIVYGEDSLAYLKKIKKRNIWIICDQFLAASDGMKMLLGNLDKSNDVSIFSDVVPDPPIAKVAAGVIEAEKVQAQIMIAFGGGSAIDTAKGIYYFAKLLKMAEIENFIAIPTTSGTGSEVTSATVIADPETKIKYPLFLDELIPDMAILDANLVVTVPPNVTANTGMDVLTHAIEAYVSKNASHCSDAFAEKSVFLTLKYLVSSFEDGTNLKARDNMHNASTIAGMAFNSTNLGINHSIAHQLGAQFHIPHGLANAMLLAPVIQFNASKNRDTEHKYAQLARICTVASRADSDETAVRLLCERIMEMMEAMNMSKNLQEAGVSYEQVMGAIDEIATNALQDACLATNPVQPTHQEIQEIVKKLM